MISVSNEQYKQDAEQEVGSERSFPSASFSVMYLISSRLLVFWFTMGWPLGPGRIFTSPFAVRDSGCFVLKREGFTFPLFYCPPVFQSLQARSQMVLKKLLCYPDRRRSSEKLNATEFPGRRSSSGYSPNGQNIPFPQENIEKFLFPCRSKFYKVCEPIGAQFLPKG